MIQRLYCGLYFSPVIILVMKLTRMRWVGHVACTGESRAIYRDLVVKPDGKRPLGRPRCNWEDNIKVD
jgi:hypothetical protein